MIYEHGGDIYSHLEKGVKMLDFSANINPLGLPPQVSEALASAQAAATVYPDPYCRALCRSIGEFYGVSPEKVVCGNGAADLIDRIAYGLKPKTALVTAPTFSEYEKSVTRAGGVVFRHILNENQGFEIGEDILEAIREKKPQMVFLCNPNNPTGLLTEKPRLLEIARLCREQGTTLVVDECFLDFTGKESQYSLMDSLEDFPNLIILKAFTKFFAMPGIRLGYLLTANPHFREAVWAAGQPWSVSGIAQTCGIAALKDSVYIQKTLEEIPRLRQELMKALTPLPITLYPGTANFLLFRADYPALDKKIQEKGILIRNCGNYPGLGEGFYRVAVKSQEDNQKLSEALTQVLL